MNQTFIDFFEPMIGHFLSKGGDRPGSQALIGQNRVVFPLILLYVVEKFWPLIFIHDESLVQVSVFILHFLQQPIRDEITEQKSNKSQSSVRDKT